MKRIALFIMVMAIVANAGNIFNQTVTYDEGYSYVHYSFVFTFVDSSDAYHSKPVFIADCNGTDGYASAWQSTTGDANIIYHFSSDLTKWFTTTPAGFDATSSTAKFDTIGVEAGTNDVKFHGSMWLVVEVVGGGTNNQDDNVFHYDLYLNKDTDESYNGNPVRTARVAAKSVTNP